MISLGIHVHAATVLDQLAEKMVRLADCSNGCYSLAGFVVNVLPSHQCGWGSISWQRCYLSPGSADWLPPCTLDVFKHVYRPQKSLNKIDGGLYALQSFLKAEVIPRKKLSWKQKMKNLKKKLQSLKISNTKFKIWRQICFQQDRPLLFWSGCSAWWLVIHVCFLFALLVKPVPVCKANWIQCCTNLVFHLLL